jgi:thymidine kinase
VIKYKNDTRYSEDCASTHDKQTLKAISAAKLSEIDSGRLDEMDVVAIDEGQFFPGEPSVSCQQSSSHLTTAAAHRRG